MGMCFTSEHHSSFCSSEEGPVPDVVERMTALAFIQKYSKNGEQSVVPGTMKPEEKAVALTQETGLARGNIY